MSELDRQIAEKVMGEPKPEEQVIHGYEKLGSPSWGGNWSLLEEKERRDNALLMDWTPLPFSSRLDLAMKAVDTYFERLAGKRSNVGYFLDIKYDWGRGALLTKPAWWVYFDKKNGAADTLPEAICNLLLALVEGRN